MNTPTQTVPLEGEGREGMIKGEKVDVVIMFSWKTGTQD
jgi:hypothetical protein